MTPSTPRAGFLTRGTALIAFLLLGTAGVLFLPDWLTRLDKCKARVAELETQLASAGDASPRLAAAQEQLRAATDGAAKARQELAAARTELAALQLRAGQPGRAREAADAAVRAHESAPLPYPTAARAYLLRGLARLEEGDRDGGDTDVKKAHELAATPESFYALARSARANGSLPEAERHLREALRREPENPAFLCERAVIERAQGRLDLAQEALDAVLEKVPDHAEAAFDRGLIHLARYELDKAAADFQRAGGPEARYLRVLVAAEKSPLGFREALLRGFDLDELEAHIDPLRRYVEKCQRDADASFRLGLLYLAKAEHQAAAGQTEAAKSTAARAAEALTSAVDQASGFLLARLVRGMALRAANKIPEAKVDFEWVLAIDPELSLANVLLGYLCFDAVGIEAVDYFCRLLKVSTPRKEALAYFNRVLEGHKESPAVRSSRAKVLRFLGGAENLRQAEQDEARAIFLGYPWEPSQEIPPVAGYYVSTGKPQSKIQPRVEHKGGFKFGFWNEDGAFQEYTWNPKFQKFVGGAWGDAAYFAKTGELAFGNGKSRTWWFNQRK